MVIFVMILLPVFILVAALAIDSGWSFAEKRVAQNAADAAAAAAAQELLNTGTCPDPSSCVTMARNYVNMNFPGATTVVNWPYKGDSSKVEVKVSKSISGFFAGVTSFRPTVHARAVGAIQAGPPPPYTFVSLNSSCDNHTLVIRLSAHLTVTNTIYVNSCSGLNNGKGDGFDIFGTGGDLHDPADILTHGGWETHTGLSVYVGKDPVTGNYYQCPYDTAKVVGGLAVPAWVAGCPKVNQPLISDPFSIVPPPALNEYAVISNSTCSSTSLCFNSTPFTPPWFLDSSLADVGDNPISQLGRFDGVATIVTSANHGLAAGDTATVSYPPNSSFSGSFPVTAAPTTKSFTYANPGPDVGAANDGAAQNVNWRARWNNVATLTMANSIGALTDTSPNNRVSVTMTGADTSFNGTTNINSGSLVNGSKSFSYASAGANSVLGPSIAVTQVNRNANVATLNVASTGGLVVGRTVIVNVAAPNTSFNNGGNPVVLTSVTATQIKYANTGSNLGNTAATGTINLIGEAPSAGSKVQKLKAGQVAVAGACTSSTCVVADSAPSTVVADPGGTTGAGANPANNSYITIDGERMKVTNNNVAKPAGTIANAKAWTVTRARLGSVSSAHNEPPVEIVSESMSWNQAESANIAIVTTATPHGLSTGDWVRVNVADTAFDGVWQVTGVPDDEEPAGPFQIEFIVPGAKLPDIGGAAIAAASRYGGEATLRLSTPLPAGIAVGDDIAVNVSSGDTSFNEESEDEVEIDFISGDRLQVRYPQPGLPDTFDTIHQVGRLGGITEIVTKIGDAFRANGDTVDVAYPPDASFSGIFTPITVLTAKSFTYSNPGSDVGVSVDDTQPVLYAARWNGVATVETQGALRNIDTVWPDNRVVVNLAGADTSFNGTYNITSLDPNNGKKTFSYPSPGTNSSLGPDVNVTAATRNNAGLVTLTVTSTATLDVGDLVIVNLANTSYNNGGNPVTVTKVNSGTQFQYQMTGSTLPTSTGKFNLVGGAPPGGSTVQKLKLTLQTVDGAGGSCPTAAATCTVKPFDDATVVGIVGQKAVTCPLAGCITPKPFQIFTTDPTQVLGSGPTSPSEYKIPRGTDGNLSPGIYYGGICLGAPFGANCAPNVGGTCATTSAAGTASTVHMDPGVYIIAGGGFYVCGNTTLNAPGVMIYNTQDSAAAVTGVIPAAGKLQSVYFNTNGNVTLSGPTSGRYENMTVFQGKDPASPTTNLAVADLTKCDGRNVAKTDIVLLHTGNGLNGFSGTIYAPNQYALFNDSISGTTNMAVITGCILITAGSDATFDFQPTGLFGLGSGISE